MYGLMYKDLAVNKKNLLILFGGFLLMHILQFLGGGELEDENAAFLITAMSVAMAFMISGAAQSYLFSADERKKFAFWVISSQTGVKSLVGAKYLFVYALAVLSVVLSISINVQTGNVCVYPSSSTIPAAISPWKATQQYFHGEARSA